MKRPMDSERCYIARNNRYHLATPCGGCNDISRVGSGRVGSWVSVTDPVCVGPGFL